MERQSIFQVFRVGLLTKSMRLFYGMSQHFNRFLIKIPTRYGWMTTYCNLGGLSYLFGRPSDKAIAEAFIIKPGDVVFDVGAHVGWYSLLANKRGAIVLAFEPDPENCVLLHKNADCHSDIIILNFAVSNKIGKALLNIDKNPAAHSIIQHHKKQMFINTVALDDFYEIGIAPNLIKVDVEGAELLVLEGARNILQDLHPKLIIETMEPEKIAEFLHGFGYGLTQLTSKDYLAD